MQTVLLPVTLASVMLTSFMSKFGESARSCQGQVQLLTREVVGGPMSQVPWAALREDHPHAGPVLGHPGRGQHRRVPAQEKER